MHCNIWRGRSEPRQLYIPLHWITPARQMLLIRGGSLFVLYQHLHLHAVLFSNSSTPTTTEQPTASNGGGGGGGGGGDHSGTSSGGNQSSGSGTSSTVVALLVTLAVLMVAVILLGFVFYKKDRRYATHKKAV